MDPSDVAITEDETGGLVVELRAERSGTSKAGRVYHLTAAARDKQILRRPTSSSPLGGRFSRRTGEPANWRTGERDLDDLIHRLTGSPASPSLFGNLLDNQDTLALP